MIRQLTRTINRQLEASFVHPSNGFNRTLNRATMCQPKQVNHCYQLARKIFTRDLWKGIYNWLLGKGTVLYLMMKNLCTFSLLKQAYKNMMDLLKGKTNILTGFSGTVFIQQLIDWEKQNGYLKNFWKEWEQQEKINFQVSKGQAIKRQLEQRNNRKSETDQNKGFQAKDTDQEQKIKKVIKFMDNKVVRYLQAQSGNSLATNIIRLIDQKNKDSCKKIKIFYYDFKQPPFSLKEQNSKWGQAQDIHNLLTNLIYQKKKEMSSKWHPRKWPGEIQKFFKQLLSKKQTRILMINNIHLLDSCFQGLKMSQREELFKQIMYIHKQKIANVIIISENPFFYDSCIRKLQSVDHIQCIPQFFPHMVQEDIIKVLHARMAYDKLSLLIGDQGKTKLDKIISTIVKNNNNVKECLRVLNIIQFDLKKIHEDHLKKQNLKYNQKYLDKYLRQQFVKEGLTQKNNFINKLNKAQIDCQAQCIKLIITKKQHILKSIGLLVMDPSDKDMLQKFTKVKRQKLQILNDINDLKYQSQVSILKFYQNCNEEKMQALLQLKKYEVLHGFKFASRSTQLGYQKVVQVLNNKPSNQKSAGQGGQSAYQNAGQVLNDKTNNQKSAGQEDHIQVVQFHQSND